MGSVPNYLDTTGAVAALNHPSNTTTSSISSSHCAACSHYTVSWGIFPSTVYGMFSFTKATRESRDSCNVFISFSDFRYAPNAFSKVSLSEIKSSGSSYKSHICSNYSINHLLYVEADCGLLRYYMMMRQSIRFR